jgi:hypothetical protein
MGKSSGKKSTRKSKSLSEVFEEYKSHIVKEISALHPDMGGKAKAAFDFRTTLNAETDRGCALMAAAYLDDQLGELLRAYFVDDLRIIDELLGPAAPLGSFSSRVDLAYSLGLIGPHGRRELHLIRKIRNDFGHRYAPMSFNDAAIRSRCLELRAHQIFPASRPRGTFTRTVMGILATLHTRITSVGHRPTGVDVPTGDEIATAIKSLESPRRVRSTQAKRKGPNSK